MITNMGEKQRGERDRVARNSDRETELRMQCRYYLVKVTHTLLYVYCIVLQYVCNIVIHKVLYCTLDKPVCFMAYNAQELCSKQNMMKSNNIRTY